MVSKFLETHKHLLAVIIVVGMIIFLGNKYLDKSYDSAVARNQAAQQVLSEQVQKNADLQKQQDAREQQYQQLLTGLQKQNATLIASISARNAVVVGQQKADAGLALPELALRHKALLGVSSGIASTENGFLISSPVELQTVQSLETLPVLKQNNQDLQTLTNNKDSQITSLNGLLTGSNGEIDGLRAQLTDSQKVCDARVSVARKSRWKYFKMGAVTGFIGGLVVGHKIP